MNNFDPCDGCKRGTCAGCRVNKTEIERANLDCEIFDLKQMVSKRDKQLKGAIETAYKLRGQLIKLTAKKEY